MSKLNAVIGKRLKEARIARDMSHSSLGLLVGVDDPTVHQYELGKETPDLLIVERLAAVLKVPEAFFFCEDDEIAMVIVNIPRLRKYQRTVIVGYIKELIE